MKVLTKLAFIVSVLILPIFCFCETDNNEENNIINIIDRETYQVQIKQYNKDYPIVLYVIFKESTPLLNEIRKILRTELLIFTKKEIEPTLKDNSKTKTKKKDKDKDNKDKQKETETGLKTIKKVVIASAWFDDQVSENLEKIELTKKYGAFVWLYDEIDKSKVFTFEEYLKYLKKKKEDSKKKEKTENSKDIQK